MTRTTKYVALDVHQATTVALVREEGGRVIARSVLPTDGGALTPPYLSLLRWCVEIQIESAPGERGWFSR